MVSLARGSWQRASRVGKRGLDLAAFPVVTLDDPGQHLAEVERGRHAQSETRHQVAMRDQQVGDALEGRNGEFGVEKGAGRH